MSSGSTAAVDSAQFRSGTKSVKFVAATKRSKTAYIRLASKASKQIFPLTPNVIYGRMMFRLESAPTAAVHWTFLQGSGLIAGQTYHALYRYGGQHPVMQGTTFVGNQLMANYETPDSYSGNGPSSDCWKHANAIVVPVGTWSCAEWQFDGPANTMRFWLNGAAVDSLTVVNTGSGCGTPTAQWTRPRSTGWISAWESYQQDSARTIWIDDVVVSKTRAGCPSPEPLPPPMPGSSRRRNNTKRPTRRRVPRLPPPSATAPSAGAPAPRSAFRAAAFARPCFTWARCAG